MQKGTYLTWVHRCRREHTLHGYIDAEGNITYLTWVHRCRREHTLHGYIDAEGNITYMGT